MTIDPRTPFDSVPEAFGVYRTPLGFDNLRMSSDGEALTGLWFDGSRDEGKRPRGGGIRNKVALLALEGRAGTRLRSSPTPG